MAACDIIIDTNQTLHFQRLDQIDWCALTECDDCTLLITPILLRELEHNKVFNPSKPLRHRAGRMIDYLVALTERPDPIELRPNVTLVFVEKDAGIDFAAHGLVREINDDHHIAAAIERHAVTGRRTMIASGDGGMALKLRSRPIGILRLPDELKLDAEVDPDQEELRQLRQENARLKSQRPKLRLTFADGSTKFEIRNPPGLDLNAQSLSEIVAAYPSLPLPGTSGAVGNDVTVIAQGVQRRLMGDREQVERYNDELQIYFRDYEAYLGKLDEWAEFARLTSPIGLTLHNDGTATATNVEVIVTVPETALLFPVGEWLGEPDEPAPPRRPGILPVIGGYDSWGQELSIPDYLLPRDRRFAAIDFHDGAAGIDDDNHHVVEFSARSLKQKCELLLDEFLLTHAPALSGKGIELDVKITLHEGEPVHQKLALIFRDDDPAGTE